MGPEATSPRSVTAGRALQHRATQTTSRRPETICVDRQRPHPSTLAECRCRSARAAHALANSPSNAELTQHISAPRSATCLARLGIQNVRNMQRGPERSILRLQSGHVIPKRSGTSRSQMPTRQPEQTAEGGGEGGGGGERRKEERRGWGQRSGGGAWGCLSPLRPVFQARVPYQRDLARAHFKLKTC